MRWTTRNEQQIKQQILDEINGDGRPPPPWYLVLPMVLAGVALWVALVITKF